MNSLLITSTLNSASRESASAMWNSSRKQTTKNCQSSSSSSSTSSIRSRRNRGPVHGPVSGLTPYPPPTPDPVENFDRKQLINSIMWYSTANRITYLSLIHKAPVQSIGNVQLFSTNMIVHLKDPDTSDDDLRKMLRLLMEQRKKINLHPDADTEAMAPTTWRGVAAVGTGIMNGGGNPTRLAGSNEVRRMGRKMGDDSLCNICARKLARDRFVKVLKCKHFFHPLCITEWLHDFGCCPMCMVNQLAGEDEDSSDVETSGDEYDGKEDDDHTVILNVDSSTAGTSTRSSSTTNSRSRTSSTEDGF